MSPVLRRSLYHILGGLVIPIAALFLPKIVVQIFLGALTFSLLTVEITRLRVPTVNQWFFKIYKPLARTNEASRLTGTSYLIIASLISFLVFQRDIAVIALSFLAVGDAVAGIVGRWIGKRHLLGKTLEGDLACFFSCTATGSIFYFAGSSLSFPTIMIGAAIASVVEAIPLQVNDNLTIPLLSGAVMTLLKVL
jgi:glycerol-3-phosphate acyltransferase PlsY